MTAPAVPTWPMTAENIEERVRTAADQVAAGGHIANLVRAKLSRADLTGASEVFSPAECAWIQTRDRDAENATHARELAQQYRGRLHRILDEAGPGRDIVGHLRRWIWEQAPARQKWLTAELLPLVQDWINGVAAIQAALPADLAQPALFGEEPVS